MVGGWREGGGREGGEREGTEREEGERGWEGNGAANDSETVKVQR